MLSNSKEQAQAEPNPMTMIGNEHGNRNTVTKETNRSSGKPAI